MFVNLLVFVVAIWFDLYMHPRWTFYSAGLRSDLCCDLRSRWDNKQRRSDDVYDYDDGNDNIYDHDDDLMIRGELEAWYVHTLPTNARSAAGGLRARLENWLCTVPILHLHVSSSVYKIKYKYNSTSTCFTLWVPTIAHKNKCKYTPFQFYIHLICFTLWVPTITYKYKKKYKYKYTPFQFYI